MIDAILDALIDTLKVIAILVIINVLLSFIETKLASKMENKGKSSPLIGASIGLIPQCGFSIVACDLYKKKYISIGTVLAVFIACSDEALPIILSSPSKIKMALPLLLVKFIVAVIFGYLIDFILKGRKNLKDRKEHEKLLIHKGCCHHEIDNDKESKLKKHLIHPLIHSLKVGIYVLIINLIFSILIYYIGENSIKEFLNTNIYLTPFLASLVGLIPNCASSVILTELFISDSLAFGATIAGLICNAGLGLVYLFKDKKELKRNLLLTLTLFLISNIVGYLILLVQLFI